MARKETERKQRSVENDILKKWKFSTEIFGIFQVKNTTDYLAYNIDFHDHQKQLFLTRFFTSNRSFSLSAQNHLLSIYTDKFLKKPAFLNHLFHPKQLNANLLKPDR